MGRTFSIASTISSIALLCAACGGGGGAGAGASPSASEPAQLACSVQYGDTVAAESNGPDPLLSNLWHLKNIGQARGTPGEDLNIEPAWALTLGAGVTVALLDDAVESVHPDLAKNVDASKGLDYRGTSAATAKLGAGMPCDVLDYHGTAVGGIIAARQNNGIGTVGVAPAAKLVGYSALTGDDDSAVSDALTRDLQTNAVFNSSWGAPDSGEVWSPGEGFAPAIDYGLRHGRAGKGAVYVFPAGNGGCALRTSAGLCQSELASYDGYLNYVGVLVVGSLDRFGKAPFYAEPGVNVIVSAPGGDSSIGITTTSLKGRYTDSFVGSSAAAPMVSGVSALLLSANPNLTWRDIRLILARTARRNDAANTAWKAGATQNEGGGRWFNPWYGFGAVDAFAAVRAAMGWQSVGGSEQLKQCVVKLEPQESIADNGAATILRFTFDSACPVNRVEHVELLVDIAHEYSGDLDIRLVSPQELVSELAQTRNCAMASRLEDDCGSFENWTFGSVRHLDESARGAWRLEIKDKVPGKAGTLKTASLRILGS
jgi:proprotein convertase subtilisin/kexin type 2